MNEESNRRDLSGLRIDRQNAPAPRGRKPWLWVAAVVLGLAVVIVILFNLPSFRGKLKRVGKQISDNLFQFIMVHKSPDCFTVQFKFNLFSLSQWSK